MSLQPSTAQPANISPAVALLLDQHNETRTHLSQIETTLASLATDPLALSTLQALWQTCHQSLLHHYALEEHAVFPIISQYRPMILMTVEHDDLLVLHDQLSQAVQSVTLDSLPTRMANIQAAWQAFSKQLAAHMTEEERGIFPLVAECCEPEEQALMERKLHELNAQSLQRQLPMPEGVLTPQALKLGSLPVLSQPISITSLAEFEHVQVQQVFLKQGQAYKHHWAAEQRTLWVTSGELYVQVDGPILSKASAAATELSDTTTAMMHQGDQLTLAPRTWSQWTALSDVSVLVLKVWPRPYFIRKP